MTKEQLQLPSGSEGMLSRTAQLITAVRRRDQRSRASLGRCVMASDPGRQRLALTAWEYPIQYHPIFTATLGAHSGTEYLAPDQARASPPRKDSLPSQPDPAYLFRRRGPKLPVASRYRDLSLFVSHPGLNSLDRHRGKSLVTTSQGLSRSSPSPLPPAHHRRRIPPRPYPSIDPIVLNLVASLPSSITVKQM